MSESSHQGRNRSLPSWQRAAIDPDRKIKDGWESLNGPSCKFAALRSSQVSQRALFQNVANNDTW